MYGFKKVSERQRIQVKHEFKNILNVCHRFCSFIFNLSKVKKKGLFVI